jgi:hypothetical protein
MAEVERNAALKDRLPLEVARAGGPLDLASYRRSFADALRSKSAAGGSRSYPRTSGPWARAVHESIARIGALLPAGHRQVVIELTEYALGRVRKTMSTLDDSSGWFAQIVTDLERLHHDACLAVQPDPVALARRLFAFEVDGEWDIFIDSGDRDADVLGDDGIAEMRRLAEERWAAMPERPPGSGSDDAGTVSPGADDGEAGGAGGRRRRACGGHGPVSPPRLGLPPDRRGPRRSRPGRRRPRVGPAQSHRLRRRRARPRPSPRRLRPRRLPRPRAVRRCRRLVWDRLVKRPSAATYARAAGMGSARRPVGRASSEGTRPAPG